ncbi:hypothetical protein [Bosea psychrotolerans]|uniref:Uncharacterized protein n=1 Tax=Bosea psychrotolerans TaxID=1871628 RepID=A0A2S4LTB5_9HYPH|nr:hypothetical protein [Bosea psychrotolerans]POR45668.1 hypothetical protein CYD53_13135 [Bosea psychrotolerans]
MMIVKAGPEFMSAVAAGAVQRFVLGSIDQFDATPFNIGDGSFTLRWGGSSVRMDIYPDGVNFAGPGVDHRLERYDYNDLKALADAALATLDSYLRDV